MLGMTLFQIAREPGISRETSINTFGWRRDAARIVAPHVTTVRQPLTDPSVRYRLRGSEIDRLDLARVDFVAVAAAAVWFHWWEPFATFSLIGIVATLIGLPDLQRGVRERH